MISSLSSIRIRSESYLSNKYYYKAKHSLTKLQNLLLMAAISKARASKPDTNKSKAFSEIKQNVTIVRLKQLKQPIHCIPLICPNLRFQRLYR